MSGLVLITRPAVEAFDYAQELEAQGFQCRVQPMLNYSPVDFSAPHDADAFIFTSAQGVDAYVEGGGAVFGVAYCVGKYTADAAAHAGYDRVVSAEGTGADLAAMIVGDADLHDGEFVHVGGRDVAYPIVDVLMARGIDARRLIVYRMDVVVDLSPQAIDDLRAGRIEVVTFYSKRTANAFVDAARRVGLSGALAGIKALSISEAVLECVRAELWREMYVSKTPDRAGMLQELKRITD